MNQVVHEIFHNLSEEEKLALIRDLVGSVFDWSLSKEGHTAWENIHDFLLKAESSRREARRKKEEAERLAKLTLQEVATNALRALKTGCLKGTEIADLEAVLKRENIKHG